MEKVSIIIPCKKIDEFTERCIKECLKLEYDNYEIIVLPDDKESKKYNWRVKIIPTGKQKPAYKRNKGMEVGKGYFFAFIDSDAYPKKDWLKNSIKYFENKKIGIVGGPNLTPPEANFAEKISGHVLSNFLVSGDASIRYKISRNQFTRELPSCNYIVRKETAPKFDDKYLTAEDSKFCFDVQAKELKVFYAKDVIFFHHRRDSLKKHLKQMFIYGRDIAWLSKSEFSLRKLYYGLLSLGILGFFGMLILSPFSKIIATILISLMVIYLGFMGISSLKKNFGFSLWIFLISIGTHLEYGIGWLYGMLVKQEIKQFSER